MAAVADHTCAPRKPDTMAPPAMARLRALERFDRWWPNASLAVPARLGTPDPAPRILTARILREIRIFKKLYWRVQKLQSPLGRCNSGRKFSPIDSL